MKLPRRKFLALCGASVATPSLAATALGQTSRPKPLAIKKAVKIGMIKEGKTLAEKFALLKELGYDGVELNSPAGRADPAEVAAATQQTGILVHGVVDSIHWNKRLSDPDAAIRDKGIAGLEQALRDAKAYRASSVLLVPGRVTAKERYDQCYERSQECIRKVMPLADDLDLDILIENVWNNFLLSPIEMARYCDELGPRVGVYFDIGNIVKYAEPYQWIEILGKRIKKLDVKGYNRKKGWCKIGDGNENWPKVCKALRRIGYSGWATAEVGGGKRGRLADIKQRMDKAFSY
jgi:hexulose-6-phosphate isomerase